MQADPLWLSIGLGASLGTLYIAASYLSNRHALKSRQRFMLVVVTAMLIRLMLAMVFLIGILLLLPVSPTAFLGSFFVMFVVGMMMEVWFFHRSTPTSDDVPQ